MKKALLAILLTVILNLMPLFGSDGEYSDLYLQTVGEDIQTSDFHELSLWVSRLGLSEEGSADEMRNRLYQYYNVEPPGKPDADEKAESGNLITIESADNLDYFTIEQIDENYVEIIGDVILTLKDEKTGDEHRITADKVLFNFKDDYLTASGDIQYILDSEEKTENFKGDKITFNVETWEGLFYKGVSEEVQEASSNTESSSGDDVTFYFKGDLINKTEDNFVLLEKGEITSCDLDDPHFKLKAEKLWMLSGDEWALLSGVLYLGRVPVLYIPAFLKAGDDIFFNPVFGYKNDYGYYIQTTTYLIGEKKKEEDSSFSFLQSDESTKYKKINGIYLTADEEPSDEKKKAVDSFSDEDQLKVLLDYYSNLGLYGALSGKIAEFSILKELSLRASLARTRKIENTSSGYTYLFPDENGVYSSIWESSFFLNMKLPFRYDMDLLLKLDLDWFDIDLTFQTYSDNYYTNNFSGRSEELDLLGMLNPAAAETATEITSADWMLNSSFTPELGFLKPWVSSFSISSLKASVDFRGKKIDTTALTDASRFENSVSYFYYPQEYVLPSFSASIGGQILPFGKASDEKDKAEKDGLEIELRPPWDENNEQSDSRDENIEEFMLPDLRPDVKIDLDTAWDAGNVFSNKLTYSIKPDYSNKTQLESSDWKTPDDINLGDIEYSVQSAKLNASLNYDAGLFGSLLTLDENLKFTWKNNEHYNMDSLTAEDQAKLILEDKQATEMILSNSIKLTAKPLLGFDNVSGTSLSYSLDNKIYTYDYSNDAESFLTRLMQAEAQDITKHSLALSFPLTVGDYKQTLTLSSTLPPLSLSASGKLLIEAGISKTELNTSITEANDVITYNPLTLNERITFIENNFIENNISFNYNDFSFEKNITSGKLSLFDNKLTLLSKFIYDFTSDEISELSADLKIFDFFINLKGYHTGEYSFNPDEGWQSSDNKSFQIKDFKAGLDIDSESYVLWKNRIDFDFDVKSDIDIDLVQFTDSVFNFSLSFNFKVFEFLTVKFKSVSENKVMYKYIPAWADIVGVPALNIVDDLLKSFNFFNVKDRYDSNFNLKTISVGLTHDLHDWDLSIDYSGKPYVNESSGVPVFDWENKLSIYLEWKAIDDIKTDLKIDKGEVSF